MSLIKCPNCDKSVSDQAKTCPHCGIDLTAKKTKKSKPTKAKPAPVASAPVAPAPRPPKPYRFPFLLGLFIVIAGLISAGISIFFLVKYIEKEQKPADNCGASVLPTEKPDDPTPTPTPTSENKTYKNKLFSFEYPSDWTIATDSYNNIYVTKSTKKDGTPDYPFVMIHEDDTDDMTPKDLINDYYNSAKRYFTNYEIYSDITTGKVGDRGFYQYAYTYNAPSSSNRIIDYRYTLKVSDGLFMLSSSVEEDDDVKTTQSDLNKIVKLIIKSLKKGE